VEYKSLGRFDARGFLGTADVAPEYTEVKIEAKVFPEEGASISEADVAKLEAHVDKCCPVKALFTKAGCDVEVIWTVA